MKLRAVFILLLISIAVITAAIVGGLILKLRLPEIEKDQQLRVRESVHVLANSVDETLAVYEAMLRLTATRLRQSPSVESELEALVATDGSILAAYLVDSGGRLLAIARQGNKEARRGSLPRLNIAGYPEFKQALGDSEIAWTDRFLSIATGEVVLAVGTAIGDRRLIVEIPPAKLNEKVGEATREVSLPLIILDGHGDWVASNTELFGDRLSNFSHIPALFDAMQGKSTQSMLQSKGKTYDIVSARAQRLSWTFVSAVPSGFSNPYYRRATDVVLLGIGISSLLALGLAPWLSKRASATLVRLTDKSHQLSQGMDDGQWPKSRIAEFNDLSANLRKMIAIIGEREARLQELNETLENRVVERTSALSAANQELKRTLENLRETQALLIEREKNAALGSLVAGVAHELNTPIGNALTVASALHEKMKSLSAITSEGALRRSVFDEFMREGEEAANLIERSCERAGKLIASFKRMAVDQSSEQRRVFDLRTTIDDNLAAILPAFKHHPWVVNNGVEANIVCDSFPGALGQIVTNLVQNALVHGFEGREQGTLLISAVSDQHRVRLSFADNGRGIDTATAARIFEPFFTTRLGRGGSGLGLSISQSLASHVLGGSLSVVSEPSAGATFTLDFPLLAPQSADSAFED